ncbi:unnamed protein product [Amoebophrya sp. A25]|nr:unnamed protein product [Amoebophrya sp. A25]|eukprot:GSA25T00002436001.1
MLLDALFLLLTVAVANQVEGEQLASNAVCQVGDHVGGQVPGGRSSDVLDAVIMSSTFARLERTTEDDRQLNGNGHHDEDFEHLLEKQWALLCSFKPEECDPELDRLRTMGRHTVQYTPMRGSKRILGKPQLHVFSDVQPWNFLKIKNFDAERLLEVENISELWRRFARTCIGDDTVEKETSQEWSTDSTVSPLLLKTNTEEDHVDDDASTTKGYSSRLLILRNLHPVSELHTILVPDIDLLKPQYLDLDGLVAAIAVALVSRTQRWYFNSLGAGASVNHLHFQGWRPPKGSVSLDEAPRRVVKIVKEKPNNELNEQPEEDAGVDVTVSVIEKWPLRSIVEFSVALLSPRSWKIPAATSRQEQQVYRYDALSQTLAAVAMRHISKLQAENIPHNVFIYRWPSRTGSGMTLRKQCSSDFSRNDKNNATMCKVFEDPGHARPGPHQGLRHSDTDPKPVSSTEELRVMVIARTFDNTQTERPFDTQVASLEVLGWWILPGRQKFESYSAEDLDRLLSESSIEEMKNKLLLNF